VCDVADEDLISVIPIPISKSLNVLLIVSFVTLLRTSLIITSPINDEDANDFVSSGSDFGLSLLVWGYRSFIGCGKFSFVNGEMLGLFDEFIKIK